MKSVRADLSNDIKQLKIIPISDLHIGSPECNQSQVHSYIEQLTNEKDTYCILGGDLIDNAIVGSVGDVYEQQSTPMGQLGMIISLFLPVKDKILAVVQGNHEARSYKQTGIDLMAFFCRELGISDRYDPVGICLFLRFGEVEKSIYKGKNKQRKGRQLLYTIYLSHGISGGRTAGAKANALERVSNVINADICILGHTHLPMVFKSSIFTVDTVNSGVFEKDITYINMGSTLGYSGYAEKLSLKPSSKANPTLILSGLTKKVEVIL
jgi:Predicted phosphohydrolases